MPTRGRLLWLLLFLVAGVFGALYLYFALFPGPVDPAALRYFSAAEIAAGRRYSQAHRLLSIAGFSMQVLVLVWLVFSPAGAKLGRAVTRSAYGNYLLSAFLFFFVLWVLLRLANLPFSLYRSYYLEHLWGFSTQSLAGWWTDYFKGAAIDLVLSGAGVLLLFWAMARWPKAWWFAAGTFLAVWIVIANYLWPIVIAPLFNRFTPATDPQVVEMVQQLARRANLPVNQVLVVDASRRTRKANAYFAGLGNTKRIVLYDNLLKNYPPDEVEAVVAHEMAHWKLGHILRGTFYGIVGDFALWFFLFLLLQFTPGLSRGSPYPPQVWALILLFFLLTSFISSPLINGVSRSMESAADALSVKLTENPAGAVRLQVDLARRDLADVSPPPFIEWFAYTHPGTIRRIEAMESAGKEIR